MARWALKAPHYLNVPDWEYEYTEVSRASGRSVRHRFKVPRYLHPDDANDVNYPPDIIICHEGKGLPRDIVFIGEPTPDMEPMDEEAEKISASLRSKWAHPIDSLPATGDYSGALLHQFERALNEVINRVGIPKAENTSVPGAVPDAIVRLQTQMDELIRKNLELEAKLSGTAFGPEPGEPIKELTEEELNQPPPEVLQNAPMRRV